MKDLKDKVAFITGGANGIGLAMAESFADEGMALALTDVDGAAVTASAEKLRKKGARVEAYRLDVTDPAAWRETADRCEGALGPIQVLCCNAGVSIGLMPIPEIALDAWRWLLDVNLNGVFYGVHTLVPRMKTREGHIVLTSSMAGVMSHPGLAAYTAAKHAIVGIADVLRKELKDTPLGVSVLCPGLVRTSLGDTSFANAPAQIKATMPAPGQGPGMSAGTDPRAVGDLVVRGIRENRFFLFSHPERVSDVEPRLDEIRAAFQAAAKQN